jgi:hypothetical protein
MRKPPRRGLLIGRRRPDDNRPLLDGEGRGRASISRNVVDE